MKPENLQLLAIKLTAINKYLESHDRYTLKLDKTGNPKVNGLTLTIRHPQTDTVNNPRPMLWLHHSIEIDYNMTPIMFIVSDDDSEQNVAMSIFRKHYKYIDPKDDRAFEHVILSKNNLDDDILKTKILLPVEGNNKDYDIKISAIIKNIRNCCEL